MGGRGARGRTPRFGGCLRKGCASRGSRKGSGRFRGRGLRRALGSVVGRLLFFFAALPPDDEDVADVLNCGRIERAAQLVHEGLAIIAFCALDADLDQFMGLQGALDLGEDRGREAIAGDGDDRIQVVRLRAQFASLGRRKLDH